MITASLRKRFWDEEFPTVDEENEAALIAFECRDGIKIRRDGDDESSPCVQPDGFGS